MKNRAIISWALLLMIMAIAFVVKGDHMNFIHEDHSKVSGEGEQQQKRIVVVVHQKRGASAGNSDISKKPPNRSGSTIINNNLTPTSFFLVIFFSFSLCVFQCVYGY
ncbi:hypothetical protein ABFX02_10G128000 [Erythranthe guttata]